MSDPELGVYLVPAEHVPELRALRRAAVEALHVAARDALYRVNRVAEHARNVALVADVRRGAGYETAQDVLCGWLRHRFLAGADAHVIDTAQMQTIRADIERLGFDALERFAYAKRRQYGDVDVDRLREVHDSLRVIIQARPSQPVGLVIDEFMEQHCQPPPPRERPEGPPMSPEDNAKFNEIFERTMRRRDVRWYDDWAHSRLDDRMLLGLLPPDAGARLLDAYTAARAPLEHNGYVRAWALLTRVTRDLERALVQPTIETTAGAVAAHNWLQVTIQRADPGLERWRDIATPAQVDALWRCLDRLVAEHGGESGFIDALFAAHDHGSRDHPRTAYEQVRGYLERAREQGQFFVWYHDIYDTA